MFDEVLTVLLGRVPAKTPATVAGWRAVALPEDVYPGLIPDQDSTASGILLEGLGQPEWQILDAFEDSSYQLKHLSTLAGTTGWAYTREPGNLTQNPTWDADHFTAHHLDQYTARCRTWLAEHRQRTPVPC